MHTFPPCKAWRPLIAALVTALAAGAAQADAGYDPDSLFTAREGWQLLHAAPDWTRPLTVPAAKTPVAQVVTAGATAAPAIATSARASETATSGEALQDEGQAGREGASAELTTGARDQDAPAEPEPEVEAPALAGVRYRILDRGDETPPDTVPASDRSYAFLRASAKDLGGNPMGAQQRADDEDEQHVRRIAWNDLPGGLALAIRQMPYHARWEVFVPNSSRPAGKGGAYRILRNRPMIFDVERMPAE